MGFKSKDRFANQDTFALEQGEYEQQSGKVNFPFSSLFLEGMAKCMVVEFCKISANTDLVKSNSRVTIT